MQPHRDISSTRKLPALEALQTRPQWVCWRKEQRQGKLTKVPYSATTGRRAESDNPAAWASYAQAVQALQAGTYHGLGYMFSRDYTGVDLDHCVNPDGNIDPWALTDELRLVMTEHKAALLRFARCPYVETIDGLGVLTSHIQEQDTGWVAPERQEALHYKIGVISLSDRIERFYWPGMVLLARPEAIQASEQQSEVSA